jgi:hypothetical protein
MPSDRDEVGHLETADELDSRHLHNLLDMALEPSLSVKQRANAIHHLRQVFDDIEHGWRSG